MTLPDNLAHTPPIDRFEVASTVSKEAAERLRMIYSFLRSMPTPVRPSSSEEWDRNAAQSNAFGETMSQPVIEALGSDVAEEVLGGVRVLRVRPSGWTRTERLLVYIHGGGYIGGSAKSTIGDAAHMAAATGHEVLSIDYTLAPRGKWQAVTDEVIAVWQALLATGFQPEAMGIYGGSAGGGLAAGAVLKMRDKSLPLPAALYLQSPWSDITPTGETLTTLAAAEPLLVGDSLYWGADAYADAEDQKHPYVSPVYGDYTKHFPPTLIQVGTREAFLSHAVRHYQAILSGGNESILDVYEGMPHGFPSLFMDTPEGQTAVARAAAFFARHLQNDLDNR